jgi:transposase-like protein
MAKKSELKAEERMEAVLALLRREESAAVLARRYQVSEVTLYRWRDVFLAAARQAWASPRGRRRLRRRGVSSNWKGSWRNGRR